MRGSSILPGSEGSLGRFEFVAACEACESRVSFCVSLHGAFGVWGYHLSFAACLS